MVCLFQNDGNSLEEVFKDVWYLVDIWDVDSQLIFGKYLLICLNNEEISVYDKSIFWLYNVKYIKLCNLEFGYILFKWIVVKVGISNLCLYVFGINLFFISNIFFMDLECIDLNGLDYLMMCVVNLGINFKF